MTTGPSKYFSRTQDDHGNQLNWPGTVDGYPVIGKPGAMMRTEETEDIPLEYYFGAEMLTLPQDLARYIEIKDRITNGLWVQSREEVNYDPEAKEYNVLITWVEPYGRAPDQQPG